MYDIRKLAINPTADMEVRDVDGEVVKGEDGKPLTITFYGPGSKEYVQAKTELQNEMQAAMLEQMAAIQGAGKGKKADEPKEEKSEDRTPKFLAKITASLNGFTYPGGAEALYQDPTLGHIAEDADKFVGKRGNFKPKSAKASSSTPGTQPG